MPNPIKLILSIVVAAVAIAFHIFQARAGHELNSWLALALAAFMIAAVWLFPEAKGYKGKRRDPR